MSLQTVWSTIDNLAGKLSPVVKDVASQRQKGELVITGTGIASMRQFTLEALDYIQQADMVFYLVLDLTTEAFIQAHAKKYENLRQYYGKEKHRLDSYTQMAEVMLQSVRAGNLTVGVLYGHPGVFVNPSHRAICIAREEGYEAKMLPGVSAEDCLYADLGIDPSTTGCSVYEASLMIREEGRIDTRNHLIIWQPGAIGNHAMIFNNEHIAKLADYLEESYGPDYPVVCYIAAMRPLEKALINTITIKDLRDPEAVKRAKLNPVTTIYLPPKTLPVIMPTKYACNERLQSPEAKEQALLPTSSYRLSHPEMEVAPLYTNIDKVAVAGLENYVAPEDEYRLNASPALRRAAMQLALMHHRLQRMSKDEIRELIAAAPGLTDEEREKLRGYGDHIEPILKGMPLHDLGSASLKGVPFHDLGPVPSVIVTIDVVEVADLFEAIIAEDRLQYLDGLTRREVSLVR